MAQKRQFPVGIQSFEKLRQEGFLYIDKTEIIYKNITDWRCKPGAPTTTPIYNVYDYPQSSDVGEIIGYIRTII